MIMQSRCGRLPNGSMASSDSYNWSYFAVAADLLKLVRLG